MGLMMHPHWHRQTPGFAIGSGTDVAIENSDITLAGDSLNNVSAAIAVSATTLGNIKQNLFGAFIFNVIGIPLAAGSVLPDNRLVAKPNVRQLRDGHVFGSPL